VATLSVWKFDTPDGADGAVRMLKGLSKQELIKVHDAATVSWPPDRKRPKTRQLHSLLRVATLGGAFWGTFFGALFLVPGVGLAIGAAAGAIGGLLADAGIDEDFVGSVRDAVGPGSSALFLMSSGAVIEKVRVAFEGTNVELIRTNLSADEERRLREAFADG
jgi:uncharacterized membrane protein